MKTWHRKWPGAVGNWAAMVMVRLFLLGILFISNHLKCSGKALFRRLLSIPSEVLLIADQSRKFVLQRFVLIMDHTSRTHPQRHQNRPRGRSTSSVFLAKRGLFPDLFNSFEGSSVDINATWSKHRTLFIVFRASKQKEVNHLRTAPFLDIWAPFYHHGKGDAAAPAHPRYFKYSSLSQSSLVLAANDWRVVLAFQFKSFLQCSCSFFIGKRKPCPTR